jgi:hypothetical protein
MTTTIRQLPVVHLNCHQIAGKTYFLLALREILMIAGA